jgi:hypothetical protein
MKPLIWLVLILGVPLSQQAVAQASPSQDLAADPLSLYVKVQLSNSPKLSSLKPGDVEEGDLTHDVYSGSRKLFAAGSHVRLTVDHLERRRKITNAQWPWVVKAFMPRHENYPLFKTATVSAPDGSESPLQVSLISVSRRIEVQAQRARKRPARTDAATLETADRTDTGTPATPGNSGSPGRDASKAAEGPIMSLEARVAQNETPAADASSPASSSADTVTLPSGTACRVLLLGGGLSASKSHGGDLFQARLLEPLLQDARVVMPAGSLFEGKVTKAIRPRWASRAGSLSLTFTGVILPDGNRYPVATSLTGLELSRGSHTRMDAEGGLRGERPGAVWMLINGGMTAGIAKEIDDGTQLIMEAILSGATDASTAGTARIAGTVVSGIVMITRRGRDVVLSNHTEMNITLNRPLTLSTQTASVVTPSR